MEMDHVTLILELM